MKFDVIGIGSPIMDLLISKTKTVTFPGGPVSNTLVTLSRLGLKVGLIGRIGADKEGNILKKYLKKEGVDITRLQINKYRTTKTIVKISPNYSKFLSMKNYYTIGKIGKSDLSYLKKSKSIFTLVRGSLLRDILTFTKKNKKLLFISLKHFYGEKDLSKLLKGYRPNLIFANESEANENNDLIEYFGKQNGTIVVITKGKNGCIIYRNGEKKIYPTHKIKSIDPTGAGDIFAAGFVYGYLKSWNIDKIAYFSNLVGALSTTEIGSTKRKITWDEISKLFKTFHID